MRTLSRPMFNMGGPIKAGVMHGIREPYKHGTRAALVGNPVYPKTGGREHHLAPIALAAPAAWTAARVAATRLAPRALRGIKSLFGKTTPASVTRGTHRIPGASGSYSPVTMNPSKFKPNWLGRDPLVRAVGATGKAIFNPTVGGWAGKAARFATSPSSIIAGVAYYMWPDGKERTEPPKTGGGPPGGGDKGMTYTEPGKEIKVLSDDERKAFANKQRSERVQKYMDMMGYDRSKKTAIADALIDASKIVSDRGTLDLKNIGTDLINPIIQATSKRLDKPEQIREAVGLMATKAEIEKDLSKETDALKTKLTKLQIKGAENTLAESASFEGALGKFLSDRKGAVDKATLERISRLFADAHGETFTVIEEGTEPTGDGLYMIDSGIYRVTEGNAKQIA
jgi:hypothetical protein